MPVEVCYCEKMVITYTRAALNAFSRNTVAKPLNQDLWGKSTKLHISRFPPTRRGKRAGQRKQRPILVIISGSKMNIDFPSLALSPMVSNSIKSEEHHLHKPTKNQLNIQVRTSTVCKTNNIQVECSQKPGTGSTQSETPSKVPNLLVANVMSLVPKVDEVREFIFRRNITIAFIMVSWLKETVSDGVVDIPDFAVLHQDRKRDSHEGVCAYIKEGYCRYKHLKELNCCDEHESLWLHLRPTRLPRGFSCIIAAVIYHPPKSDDRSFREHLFQSLTLVESKYPNCGILVTGDINRLDIGCLLRHFRLKQIVKEHTRKDATLDLILTNMHYHYPPPPPPTTFRATWVVRS